MLPIQSELAGDAGADRASKIKKGMPAGSACLAFSKEAAGRTQGLGAATVSTCPSPTAYKGSQTSFFSLGDWYVDDRAPVSSLPPVAFELPQKSNRFNKANCPRREF